MAAAWQRSSTQSVAWRQLAAYQRRGVIAYGSVAWRIVCMAKWRKIINGKQRRQWRNEEGGGVSEKQRLSKRSETQHRRRKRSINGGIRLLMWRKKKKGSVSNSGKVAATFKINDLGVWQKARNMWRQAAAVLTAASWTMAA